MKISFAICTHNESAYIRDLLKNLTDWINSPATQNDIHEYEIVIVDDFSTDEETIEVLNSFEVHTPYLQVHKRKLANNFAAHKNYLNSKCTGDWIFNLDADEKVFGNLLDVLPLIVENNPLVEAFWVPRVNTVDGLTFKHVQQWRWVITTLDGYRKTKLIDPDSEEYRLLQMHNLILNEDGGFVTFNQPIIAWPDMQMRFYRNEPHIQWEGNVHERLAGFTHFSILPQDPTYAIQHHKEIDRQEQQNNFYDTLV
ncbi:MAG: glycosyltransferase [Bacteroidetes bacterium]|nr:glycosyltransferase [Bacteroidota bacterium]